jgi:dihydrofolate reductase
MPFLKGHDPEGNHVKLILIMAMTADGIIGRTNHHFPDWTCSEDKRMFKRVSQEAGVVVMGSRTFDTIGRALPGRLNVVMTRRPEQYEPAENLVFWSSSPRSLIDHLDSKGFETVVLAGGATINSLFICDGLIDELYLTIAPKLFGRGLSLFAESLDVDLELLEVRCLQAQTILLTYRINHPAPPVVDRSGTPEESGYGIDTV